MPDTTTTITAERDLDPIEQRVLGSLLEKQTTVPASYPLSLNSLRTACNQTTSREPVTAYDDRTILDAIDRLKSRGLARVVWAGSGSRVLKYHQVLADVLDLTDPARALLTVLLLRGPQSAGELRARTERLHAFADKAAVDAELHALAARPVPLVREAGRRPGQQDVRWVHLLGPVPVDDAAPEDVPDREAVLARGAAARDAAVVALYDALSREEHDVPAESPLDGWLLGRVAKEADGGPIADIGCGTGRTTAYLAGHGSDVVGTDLSPGAVAAAARTYPGVPFEVGDFTRLLRPRAAAGWGAITAWYAFVHLAPTEVARLLPRLAETLAPGGVLAFAVRLGAGVQTMSATADVTVGEADADPTVRVDEVLFDRTQVLAAVAAAGLAEVEWYVRGAVGDESPGDRLYVYARSRP
jgi:uncharacterized protein YceH (UPF0502 family)/protein-L-isoaspartate O-methyltransferase